MFFNPTFISSLTLVPVVLAHLQSRFPGRISADVATDDVVSDHFMSGAMYNQDDGDFNFVAMIQVPDLTASSVAAYVAIDTYRCPGGYGFMAGLDFGVDSLDGENVSNYKAWYWWNPGSIIIVPDFKVSAGDSINIVITLSSDTSGQVIFWNSSQNQTETISVTSEYPLCGRDALWVVRENISNSGYSDFGAVTFTDAVAFGPSQKVSSPGSATTIIMQDALGNILTSVTADGADMTVTYGPVTNS